MNLINTILGFRNFCKVDEIKRFIHISISLDKSEDLVFSGHILLFKTSRQQTWIIISNIRLICVLDDISKDNFEIRWDLDKHLVLFESKVILEITVEPHYSRRSGIINFGEYHKNWLYTKKLFPHPKDLKQKLLETIITEMG
ncbi:hypothetical protein SAMN04488055_5470 [Chitinophaga niabensis]|uniref:Uncharacterized protein n=1 Tax=Chitinophaga niabensis TaxID=536979 RepID=A0A1N6KBN6_9BACT|nr:hypothetical protein SAMN04488055_5470 [Chitinophaga niabensis]